MSLKVKDLADEAFTSWKEETESDGKEVTTTQKDARAIVEKAFSALGQKLTDGEYLYSEAIKYFENSATN